MRKLLKRSKMSRFEFEVHEAISQEIKRYLDEDLYGVSSAAYARQCFYGWTRLEHPELMNRILKAKQTVKEAEGDQ